MENARVAPSAGVSRPGRGEMPRPRGRGGSVHSSRTRLVAVRFVQRGGIQRLELRRNLDVRSGSLIGPAHPQEEHLAQDTVAVRLVGHEQEMTQAPLCASRPPSTINCPARTSSEAARSRNVSSDCPFCITNCWGANEPPPARRRIPGGSRRGGAPESHEPECPSPLPAACSHAGSREHPRTVCPGSTPGRSRRARGQAERGRLHVDERRVAIRQDDCSGIHLAGGGAFRTS